MKFLLSLPAFPTLTATLSAQQAPLLKSPGQVPAAKP